MSQATSKCLSARVFRVREFLQDQQLDALIVTHLPNIFYLSNFSGSSAILVVTSDQILLVTDFRYYIAVEALLSSEFGFSETKLIRVEEVYDETLIDVLRELGVSRVGFESGHLSVSRHCQLESALNALKSVSLVQTEAAIENLRCVKDANEINTFRKAGLLLSRVVPEILGLVSVGKTERQIAAQTDRLLRESGFERLAFETIIASGPNSALPHASPQDRVLNLGELVLLDFGGIYDGYCLDLTRMVSLGKPKPEFLKLYAAVRQAQAAAFKKIRPGVTAGAVDAAARDTLEFFGLSKMFGHGTGHGLGIEIHENPKIIRRRVSGVDTSIDPILEAGMIFTVEPGVYLPGTVGVRLEDDVLVTHNGCEIITNASRELWVIDS